MRLSLSMLGGFEVQVDGAMVPPTAWKLRHPREVLQMAALSPTHRVPRDQVFEALWPGAAPKAASNRLYHTTHLLRSAFAEVGLGKDQPALVMDAGALMLNPAFEWAVDTSHFRDQVQRARRLGAAPAAGAALGQAVAQYSGDLLAGFACSDWLATHRDGLRLDYVWALSRLAEQCAQAKDHERAIGLYRKLLDVEPADELAHRALMELFDATEHPERAVQQYAACQRALRRDLDVEPTPSTRAVFERIIAATQKRKSKPLVTGSLPAQITQIAPNVSTGLTGARALAGAATSPRYTAPAHALPLIGRANDLMLLADALSQNGLRLLTITGPAGQGKTRLAHALVARCQDAFAGGVLAPSLAQIATPAELADELTAVLGVAPVVAATAPHRPRAAPAARRLLLLDRFEHIVAAEDVLTRVLAAWPDLVLVVTSQVPLRLPAEQVYRLPSLWAQGKDHAVQLFCAAAANANVQLRTAQEMDWVAQICQRLDGNALAICLAARQTPLLSLAQICSQLDQPLGLLVSSLRDVESQHLSLRHSIAWAHALLDDNGRRLLALLGVFHGSFETQDAVQVLSGFFSRERVRLGLADLLERHLLSAATEPGAPMVGPGAGPGADAALARLQLLSTVAQFARDQWDQTPALTQTPAQIQDPNDASPAAGVAPADVSALRQAHARHYVQRALAMGQRVRRGENQEAAAFFRLERNNLLAAMAWLQSQAAVAAPPTPPAVEVAPSPPQAASDPRSGGAGPTAQSRPFNVGDDVMVGAVEDALAAALTVSLMAGVAGAVADASAVLQGALDLRAVATPRQRRGSAWCAYRLARLSGWRPLSQALPLWRQARALCRDADDAELRTRLCAHLANLRLNEGQPRRAMRLLQGLIARQEARGDSARLVGHHALLAVAQHALGQTHAGVRSAQAAVHHAQRSARPPLMAFAWMLQCEQTLRVGDLPAARQALAAAKQLPRTCLTSLREFHLQYLDAFVHLEGADFEAAARALQAITHPDNLPQRLRLGVLLALAQDLVRLELGQPDTITSLHLVDPKSLPRNLLSDDLGIIVLCARLRLFAARAEWYEAAQCARLLLDRARAAQHGGWSSWAYESCALALLHRQAWQDCALMLTLSQQQLAQQQTGPTPRQRRNWAQVRARLRAEGFTVSDKPKMDPQQPLLAAPASDLCEHIVRLVAGPPQ
jgi:DNA-binding SARP family transcriptional activator/RecA/RadA recombinase